VTVINLMQVLTRYSCSRSDAGSRVRVTANCGYRVVEAGSTDEAIAILQKTDVPVDVVTDIEKPQRPLRSPITQL
jgi:hypothetical protein